ncbi:MAG: PDZ domain-containing protein [Ruminococcaceae bacterium]|nr:PDZ domain-containing protein [Oscillospiraceae bacterium]
MSEHFQKDEEGQVKDGSAELGETEESMPSSEPVPNEEKYTYRWDYATQAASDREIAKKKKKRGILVYAITMASVFALCILLLIGVIVWSGALSHGVGAGDHTSSIGAVSEAVKPSTVLIEASVGDGISYGTGFFLTGDGYIATNYHVVEDASAVKVTTYAGKTYQATLKGYYAPDDLAVIKISGSGFSVASIGDSDRVRVGDTVVAVGNPSGAEGAWTTTHGIISALDRKVAVSTNDFTGITKMLQTDTPVNPGNSGGPLCNASGEVIGIVTQKLTNYEAIGFAIPINEAMVTLEAIIDGEMDSFESAVTTKRPVIGIVVQDIYKGEKYRVGDNVYTAQENGVLITSVSKDGPADGVLKAGDLLFELGGAEVSDRNALQDLLYKYRAGDAVAVKVYRENGIKELTVTLGES